MKIYPLDLESKLIGGRKKLEIIVIIDLVNRKLSQIERKKKFTINL